MLWLDFGPVYRRMAGVVEAVDTQGIHRPGSFLASGLFHRAAKSRSQTFAIRALQ
eukprot:SAG31_NODE_3057_length_4736_cov_28.760190_6_plen_55_part_00